MEPIDGTTTIVILTVYLSTTLGLSILLKEVLKTYGK